MVGNRIIVIDDDPMVTRSCERILGESHEIFVCQKGLDGIKELVSGNFDLALVDLKLPDVSGMDILRQAPDLFPDVPIIIMTGYSTIGSAVEAIKIGAFDYIAKPFTPQQLEAAVEKAVRQHMLLTDYRQMQSAMESNFSSERIVGESPAMQRVFSLVEQVAKTDSNVLLTGESGTGKDLLARAIHYAGSKRNAPFIALDLGTVTPTLIASELFGHTRGAFTGATSDYSGLIRAANGGVFFLDEVNSLPLDSQAILLRTLESKEVRAVGSTKVQKVDVRFISATNRDLDTLVKEGRFREDLFYRLNVFPIHLPALRERAEDIPMLARHFLGLLTVRMHKTIEGFTENALQMLMQYNWPGNVRELSNVIERLVILTPGNRIGKIHVAECLALRSSVRKIPRTVAELNIEKAKLRDEAVTEIERAFLIEALRRGNHNVTRAAEQTGMQRSNFQTLLRKHGLRIKDIVERIGDDLEQ